jgi:hypothetical protein
MPKIHRSVATHYRHVDDNAGHIDASLFPTRFPGRCAWCDGKIAAKQDVLGVAPDEPRNPGGKWIIFHLDCAGDMDCWDPVLGAKPGAVTDLFKRTADSTNDEDESQLGDAETAAADVLENPFFKDRESDGRAEGVTGVRDSSPSDAAA